MDQQSAAGWPRRLPVRHGGQLRLPDDDLHSLVVLPDDDTCVVSAENDGALHVVSLRSASVIRTLQAHTAPVNRLALADDGRLLLSASDDATIRVWDTTSWTVTAVLAGHEGYVREVAGAGQVAVSGGVDQTFRVWDLRTGECARVITAHSHSVDRVAISADGRRAASASRDNCLMLWDLTTSQGTTLYRGGQASAGHAHPPQALSFDPVSGLLSSLEQELITWDVDGEHARLPVDSTFGVRALARHPELPLAAVAVLGGVRLISLEDGSELREFTSESEVRDLCFLADARLVAIQKSGVLTVWQVGDGSTDPDAHDRWIPAEERDELVEEHLLDALAHLEDGVRSPGGRGGLLARFLRFGATLEVDVEFIEDGEPVQHYVDPVSADPSGLVLVRAADVEYDDFEEDYSNEIECVKPSPDWSAKNQALFWRLLARAYADRYADSLLNLKADALAKAIPWHLEHVPGVGADLSAWRARTLLYASYGLDEALAELRRAYLVLTETELDARQAYNVILQTCEVLDRCRPHADEGGLWNEELLALGLRGLDLVDDQAAGLADAPQQARLHHAVADALADWLPETTLSDADRERLTARYGTSGDGMAGWMRVAWQQAIDREDGDFYGEVTDGRRDERIRQYEKGLNILDTGTS